MILVPQWVPLIIAREWLLFLLDCNGRNCVPCMAVCKSLLQHEVISRILDFFPGISPGYVFMGLDCSCSELDWIGFRLYGTGRGVYVGHFWNQSSFGSVWSLS